MPHEINFWDKIATKYAASKIRNMPAYEDTMARVRGYLKPGDKVLELGCGTGSTALLLADAVAAITASDGSAAMIAIGKDKARKQGCGNIRFVQASPGDAALGTAPYDTALAFNLIHLLENPQRDLAAIHGALREGGLFISKTTCLSGLKQLLRIPIAVMQRMGKAPYVRFMSAQTLDQMITHAGFEIIESVSIPANSTNRFVIARKT